MLPDLKFLIRLQELDSAAERLRRRMADLPAAQAALEARLASLTAAVAGVKERIAASQTSRRDTEKDLAAVQARLSKYKDQLMEVKTNKEYHAMQTEITAAETLVRREEDRLLERMEGELSSVAAEPLKAGRGRRRAPRDGAASRSELEQLRHRTASSIPRTRCDLRAVARGRRASRCRGQRRPLHDCHVRSPAGIQRVRRNDRLIRATAVSASSTSSAASERHRQRQRPGDVIVPTVEVTAAIRARPDTASASGVAGLVAEFVPPSSSPPTTSSGNGQLRARVCSRRHVRRSCCCAAMPVAFKVPAHPLLRAKELASQLEPVKLGTSTNNAEADPWPTLRYDHVAELIGSRSPAIRPASSPLTR